MLPEEPARAGWTSVFVAATRRPCEEQALVLRAMDIAHLVSEQPDGCHVMVPLELAARARAELLAYRQENPRRQVVDWPAIPAPRGRRLAVAWVLVLALAWVVQNSALPGVDWLGAGELVAGRVRAGEWWRAFTALTLHADIAHLTGNIVFGACFGYLAGQHLGSGVAALAIVVLAAVGNLANALVQLGSHQSIGASTAVFAALGLVVALSRMAMRQRVAGWARAWAPLVGGIALLAFIGTGDEHTDIFAHLAGFLAGLAGGLPLRRLGGPQPLGAGWQLLAGTAAAGLLVTAWLRAV